MHKFKVYRRLTFFSHRVSCFETESGSVSKFTLILEQKNLTKQPIQFHLVLQFRFLESLISFLVFEKLWLINHSITLKSNSGFQKFKFNIKSWKIEEIIKPKGLEIEVTSCFTALHCKATCSPCPNSIHIN